MSEGRPTALSWSSGKDSAWALRQLQQDPEIQVTHLVTTVNQEFDRVAMHAVRQELVQQQARATGIPLHSVPLPWPCSNQRYEEIMRSTTRELESLGVQSMAFGDLFLEDVRAYREQLFSNSSIELLFPLWGQDTSSLAGTMIEAGLRATVTCLDPRKLSREFAGRCFDGDFLSELPPGTDPCGENGEFHTFCWDGPFFDHPIEIDRGEVVERDGFVFCDLLPASAVGKRTVP